MAELFLEYLNYEILDDIFFLKKILRIRHLRWTRANND
jgi:hypothetical protein